LENIDKGKTGVSDAETRSRAWEMLKTMWNSKNYITVKNLIADANEILSYVPPKKEIEERMDRECWRNPTIRELDAELAGEIKKTAAEIMDEKGVTINRLVDDVLKIIDAPNDINEITGLLTDEMLSYCRTKIFNRYVREQLAPLVRGLVDSRTKAAGAKLQAVELLLKLRGAYRDPDAHGKRVHISMHSRSGEIEARRPAIEDMTPEEMVSEIKRMQEAGITIDLTDG
jgi:hypothetical protein